MNLIENRFTFEKFETNTWEIGLIIFQPGYQVDEVESQKWEEVTLQTKYFADIGSLTKLSVFQSALIFILFKFWPFTVLLH